MPYAIFSKRTGIISRVTSELAGMLASESMIEIDRKANHPRGFLAKIEGQDINSVDFPLYFREGSGSPTPAPQRTVFDGDNRPYTKKNPPIYVAPQNPEGDPLKQWVDIPLGSHPFAWTALDLANQKYSSILSQNYPFQAAIGEEFINDAHIDTGNSSGYVLTAGRCLIAPAGVLQTDYFSFVVNSQGVLDPLGTSDEDGRTYVFDTYYLRMSPQFPIGVQVSWEGKRWTGDTDTGFFDAMTNEDYPTTELDGVQTEATPLRGIRLKIQNLTSNVYSIENFLLLLRARKLPYTPS